MNVVVDGSIINYQDIGKKQAKTILFLHGWADEHSTFKSLAASLSSDYRCILVDLPGFGSSESPKSALDLPDFSNFIAEFLSKIHLKPDVIVGHSNGGAIAINAIATNKISTEKLVLLASAGIRAGSPKKTAYKILAKPAKLTLKLLPKNQADKLKKTAYRQIGSDYLIAEHMKETFKKVVSYNVEGEAPNLKLPTLLIYGEADKDTPPAIGRRLNELIKGSELRIIPSGHFVHHDQSSIVADSIRRFIK